MKPIFSLFVIFTSLSIHVNAQITKHLFEFAPNPALQSHLDDVNAKFSDTLFLGSAIPETPVDFGITSNAIQHFPYPVIFVHGLVGSSNSWIDFYNYAIINGWSYGGHLSYCLNADDNLSYSNLYVGNPVDITDLTGNVPAADFYLVNFNCAPDGTCYGDYNHPSLSNQAAINKQGFALRAAIERVLSLTGKNKVILLGHSMGGLAARAYLQNQQFWQSDNDHHVAKLVTSGTPHGGSNVTGGILSTLLGIDESSDAIRDLRRNHFYSGDLGVFHFGGLEDEDVMDDSIFGFYSYDVNCNTLTGNQVQGLNQKPIPINLDYSCIIGDYSNDPLDGDLIVTTAEAQIKNYYNLLSESFSIDATHSSLPGYTKTNIESLDEPDYYDLSYEIALNTTYNGFTTKQAPDAEYQLDFDDFKFTTSQPGWINVKVENNYSFPFGISILGHPSYNYIFDQSFSAGPLQTQSIPLPAGTYYLEFYSEGNYYSWQYPYNFRINWSSNPSSASELSIDPTLTITPNPVKDKLNISLGNHLFSDGLLQIFSLDGTLVYSKELSNGNLNESIDFSIFPTGLYLINIRTDKGQFSSKISKADY